MRRRIRLESTGPATDSVVGRILSGDDGTPVPPCPTFSGKTLRNWSTSATQGKRLPSRSEKGRHRELDTLDVQAARYERADVLQVEGPVRMRDHVALAALPELRRALPAHPPAASCTAGSVALASSSTACAGQFAPWMRCAPCPCRSAR